MVSSFIRLLPGPDQDIERKRALPEPGENLPPADLPEAAFHSVPIHDPVSMLRNHQAEPGPRPSRRQKEDVQVRRLLPPPLPEKRPDVPGPGDSTRRGESEPSRRPRSRARQTLGPYFEPTLTTRRRRPLWRRRLRVFRPPLVCMRARNPCLFFRFRFRGLYVGIMANHPPDPRLRSKISFQRYQREPWRVNPGNVSGPTACPGARTLRLTFPQSRNSLLPPKFGHY